MLTGFAFRLAPVVFCFTVAGFLAGLSGAASGQGQGDSCHDPFPIGPLPYLDTGSTQGLQDDLLPPPGACGMPQFGFGQGPDAIYLYQLAAPRPDSLYVYVAPRENWDPVLYVIAQDCFMGPCVAGANRRGPGEPEDLVLQVSPFTPYFIVVDGLSGSNGPYFFSTDWERADRCRRIFPGALAAVTNIASGWGPVDTWKAETSPTSTRLAPPPPCRAHYHMPSPGVDPAGNAIWIANARAEKGGRFLGWPVPSSAVAVVQLIGNYTVLPKPIGGEGPIPCDATITIQGRQIAITGPPFGQAKAYIGTRILVQPFWDPPVWPSSTISRMTFGDDEDEDYAEAWDDGDDDGDVEDSQTRMVPVNVPQFIDLMFEAKSQAFGNAFARVHVGRCDLTIECPDDFPTSEGEDAPRTGKKREVEVNIREVLVNERPALQRGQIYLPGGGGFTYSFLALDSLDTPTGLAWSEDNGFGDKLYLTLPSGTPEPAFAESIAADTSRIVTYRYGAPEDFPGGDPVLAVSDLEFDRAGAFSFDLHAASADKFEPLTGAPVIGHGTVEAFDASGARSTLATGLDSPVALAFAPSGAGWDGNLYVAQIGSGEVTRVTAAGAASAFATGLASPTDLAFGSGTFGDFLYVAEADSLQPDTLYHATAGRLVRLDAGGAESAFASGLHLPLAVVRADAAGPFGDYLYVALGNELDSLGLPVPETGSVVRVDPAGSATVFASGLESPTRLAFGPPEVLNVAVSGGLVRIAPEAATSVAGTELIADGWPLQIEAAPNPFRGQTRVRFDLARETQLRFEVFDVTGRRVAMLGDARFGAGRHEIAWDGATRTGRRADPGVYFLRVSSAASGGGHEGEAVTRRLVVVE